MFSRLTKFILCASVVAFFPNAALCHEVGADFDGDGFVGFSDFVLFAQAYGSSDERFDLNEDGAVGFGDFIAFSIDYGRVTHEEGESEVIRAESTWQMIQSQIFATSCISASCHSSKGSAGGLTLESAGTYENLVGAVPQDETARDAGLKRVEPGDPDASFLVIKLTGSRLGMGDPMPRGFSSLSGVSIDAVRAWIEAGAPKEGRVATAPDISSNSVDRSHQFEPPAPPDHGIQLHLKSFAIAPREEREIFSTISLVSDDLMVNKIEVFQTEGSHHFIIYQVDPEKASPPGIRDLDVSDPLQAVGIFSRRFIVGSQSPYAVFPFPPGIAIPMPANQVYELNSHFVNVSHDTTLIGEVYVNLHTIPPAEVEHIARPIFVSNFGIAINPGQTVTSAFNWQTHPAVKVLMLSSHMHRHGRQFDVFLGGERIYRSLEWDDPETLLFDPPLDVPENEPVRFECTHENDDKDHTIRFGFTAENDEMCIMLGYYY